jgi:hypothetical protein
MGMNQIIVGVSEDHPSGSEGGESGSVAASTYYIGRKQGMNEQPDAGDGINRRVTVRIRNAVSLCLPQLSIGNKPVYNWSASGGSPQYNFPENPKAWTFCSTPVEQRI